MYFPSSLQPMGASGASPFGGVNALGAMQNGMQTAYMNPMLQQQLAQTRNATQQQQNQLAFQSPLLAQQLAQQQAQSQILNSSAQYAMPQQQALTNQMQGQGQFSLAQGRYGNAYNSALANEMQNQGNLLGTQNTWLPSEAAANIQGTRMGAFAPYIHSPAALAYLATNPGARNNFNEGLNFAVNPGQNLQNYRTDFLKNTNPNSSAATRGADGLIHFADGAIGMDDPSAPGGFRIVG